MKKAGLIAFCLLLGCALLVPIALHAAQPWCPECHLVTLPWENGPQGICLDLLGWGYEWCYDGWGPGDYCITSNDYCDSLTYESPTF